MATPLIGSPEPALRPVEPVDDPDCCGRVRDNLSIAAQGADARLAAMETALSEGKRFEANLHALARIKSTIAELGASA